MIERLTIWQGTHVLTYQDELNQWMDESDDMDIGMYFCGDIDPDDMDHEIFQDTGGLFSGKTLLLMDVDIWKAPSTTAKKVVNLFDKMTCPVKLGLVFSAGEIPSKGLLDLATDEFHYHGISPEPDEMSEWIQNWLKPREVLISQDEALKVANFMGYDRIKMVDAVTTVATTHRGHRVISDDITSLAGMPGEMEISDIISAVVNGDRSKTAEMMQRFSEYDPFYLKALIETRFRAYSCLAFNSKVDLEGIGIREGMAYYVKREFNSVRMKKGHVVKALELISDTDTRMKSGVAGVEAFHEVDHLYDGLARIFSIAS